MTDDYVSISGLYSRARSVPQRISLDLLLGVSNAKMIDLIDEALDHQSQLMARNAELKQEHSEDELTIEIVSALVTMGFNAHHDKKIGGHCDISIENDTNFLWLAEAKKFDSDYGWLMKGFNQLCSRYSTGTVDQDVGCIIIYIFTHRTDKILQTWGERLAENVVGISVDDSTKEHGYIYSTHPHRRTGLPYTIRHKAISLLWDPA